MQIFKELQRRNVFRVTIGYIISSWLIIQVADLVLENIGAPDWVMQTIMLVLALGFPVVVFFSWAYEVTPGGIKRESEIDRSQSITHVTGSKLDRAIMAALIVALAYFAYDKFVLSAARDTALIEATTQAVTEQTPAEAEAAAESDKSIAVLPFVNMSDDASNEYFSDGISEELLNLLSKIPELRVTSRSSAFSFKGENIHIPTVAKKLNVAYVLEGSVRKAGNRVRITAQLVKADADVHMWSETYDRELDNVFAIQDEIAKKVVTVLQVKLLGALPVSTATDSAAYSFYLQGKHYLESAGRSGTQESEDAFRKALMIDPEYAPAWAGLSRTLRSMANWGQIDISTGTEEARQAAIKALQLDDTLADAWAMLAHIQWVYDWDWNTAEGTAKTALLHGPHDANALEVASRVASSLGHFEESLKFALAAVEVDPLNPFVLRNLALTHWLMNRNDLAEEVYRRILRLYPDREGSPSNVARYMTLQGRPEEAWQLVQTEESEIFRTLVSALVLHDLGRTDEALRANQHIIDNAGSWLAYQIAQNFAYMGDVEAAFQWLEITLEQRDGGMTYILGDPMLTTLHDDSRWEPFLLKVGLLDAWKELKARESANTHS